MGEVKDENCGQAQRGETPDALSGLGAHEHPEGSLGVGALPEESLHLNERPKEDQVSVHGEQFPPHHQAGHLKTEPSFRHLRRTKGITGRAGGFGCIKCGGKGPKLCKKMEKKDINEQLS